MLSTPRFFGDKIPSPAHRMRSLFNFNDKHSVAVYKAIGIAVALSSLELKTVVQQPAEQLRNKCEMVIDWQNYLLRLGL